MKLSRKQGGRPDFIPQCAFVQITIAANNLRLLSIWIKIKYVAKEKKKNKIENPSKDALEKVKIGQIMEFMQDQTRSTLPDFLGDLDNLLKYGWNTKSILLKTGRSKSIHTTGIFYSASPNQTLE